MDGGRFKSRKWSRGRTVRSSGGSNGKLSKKQHQSSEIRRCICSPVNHTVVHFPIVWSELRSNEQLCDGLINCARDRSFPIHRAILSAVSPYFKALFVNSLKSGKNETNEVSIDFASPDIFRLILDYAYTGTCNVTADNVEQLLPLADQFEVLGIVQLCCQFLLQELRPENCLGIVKFARYYFCNSLEEKGRKFIRYRFKSIFTQSPEFKDLTHEELVAILQDDDLNVRNEELVFEAMKSWVEFNSEKRKSFLPTLLSCIRFGFLNYNYFNNTVLRWKFVVGNKKCKKILALASDCLNEQEAKYGEIDLHHPLSKPRIPYEILFAIGGWSAGSPTNFIETYDTRADRWFLSVNTDVTPRAYHRLCVLDNLIYMIGGYDGKKHFNTVRCFDPITKEWRERACMYNARCYVSLCTHGGKIYALGGYNGYTRMNSAERYDPVKNQWELIPSMYMQRSDASAAALEDKIYIVGGFNGLEIFNTAEVFDVETNQWSFIRSMIHPRSGVSLVTYRDTLYALGGYNGAFRLSSVECYNPRQNDSWYEIAEMCTPRSNFAAVILDDMIFVIGGFNGTTTIASVECFDVDSNEWYDAAPMNLTRSGLSACVIAGLPNAREYSYLSKAENIGQGQALSMNQNKPNNAGEGVDINFVVPDEHNFSRAAPFSVEEFMDGIAEGVENFFPNDYEENAENFHQEDPLDVD
ncbi:kelch-like protein 10 [Prorops nasuta]|uniref:kelch-like protein 10 n=1 Tax=Prorops nasuta TaxID=863751 RepID=UPI0034CF830A